jgi:L-asparaginase/Glu-tRNA(Gln) amidotransferase subunit D
VDDGGPRKSLRIDEDMVLLAVLPSRSWRGGRLFTYRNDRQGLYHAGRGLIPANALDARKARTTLQLLLSDQADVAKVRTVFDRF